MYEIKITVSAPEVADAIHHLATAIENRPAAPAPKKTKKPEKEETQAPVTTAPTIAPVQASAIASGTAPVAPAPTTMTTPTAPATVTPTQAPAPAPAPVPQAPQKTLTITEISTAGAALVDRGMMPQLCELLGRYGVQTVLSLVPAQYEAFANDLRALGAPI